MTSPLGNLNPCFSWQWNPNSWAMAASTCDECLPRYKRADWLLLPWPRSLGREALGRGLITTDTNLGKNGSRFQLNGSRPAVPIVTYRFCTRTADSTSALSFRKQPIVAYRRMKFTVSTHCFCEFFYAGCLYVHLTLTLTDRSIIYWAQIDDFSLIKNTGASKFLTWTKSLIGIHLCLYIVTKITSDCIAIRSLD